MMNRNNMHAGWLTLLALGCGMPATESDVKMAGVGLDPDEIGAYPEPHGGLIEYSLIDFAGAQLPLGLVGLVSYDQVGPDVGFEPPYKMVMGSAYIFQDDIQAPHAALGTLAIPPAAAGVCQTRFEPRASLSNLADVGHKITFTNKGEDGGVTIGRRPFVYPTDMRNVFVYYSELDFWKPEARYRQVQMNETNDEPGDMKRQVFRQANFPEGQLVEVDFPGGVPPMEGTMGSIPLPLSSVNGSRSLVLPNSPSSVRIGWNGPRFDRFGRTIESSGAAESGGDTGEEVVASAPEENSTCLQYLPHTDGPASSADCIDLAETPRSTEEYDALGLDFASRELNGQMYTGPWDTDDQQLVFEWAPGPESTGEVVTLSVRFLGPVDRQNENMVKGMVTGSKAASGAQSAWDEAIASGDVPSGTSLPDGRREVLSCDEPYEMGSPAVLRDEEKEIEWPLDPSFTYEDDSFVPSLHGDPGHNLAEVTCRLDDQAGRFVLTQDMVDKAMDYAALHGSGGAVFFFSRSTETEVQGPPVRDRYGKRHDTSPIKVVSHAMQVGRFWYGQ
jgi:hypothetical protein